MIIFSNNIIKKAKDEIIKWMESPGVQLCMRAGSVGFENFIQVNLAGALEAETKCDVMIESDKGATADIIIRNPKDKRILAGIQIKIVRLGTFHGDAVKINLINDDIKKLRENDFLKESEKVFICIIYEFKKHEKSWGELVGTAKNKLDYRDELGDLYSGIESKAVKFNDKKGCIDIVVLK